MEMSLDLYRDILGIPRPSEESLQIYSRLIVDTIDQVNNRLKITHHTVPDESTNIINLSLSFYPPDVWRSKFTHLRELAFDFFTTPDTLWATIAVGFYSPEIGEAYKKMDPSFNPEKYSTKTIHPTAPLQPSPKASTAQTRKATQTKRPHSIPKPQSATVPEFILRRSPSPAYELVYSTTLRHYNRGLSSTGKKVYSKGQAYIKKATGSSRSTVDRAWAWLKRRGIFNKARNENPKQHRCSLWYVCTSMKQVAYFRDPEKRHPKKKRHD